jgi:hypothetical protein
VLTRSECVLRVPVLTSSSATPRLARFSTQLTFTACARAVLAAPPYSVFLHPFPTHPPSCFLSSLCATARVLRAIARTVACVYFFLKVSGISVQRFLLTSVSRLFRVVPVPCPLCVVYARCPRALSTTLSSSTSTTCSTVFLDCYLSTSKRLPRLAAFSAFFIKRGSVLEQFSPFSS